MNLLKDTLYDIAKQDELPEDLVAISTNLSPELVLEAYPMGLFPWHQDDKFFYWFSPDPRMVLYPEKIKISKSMRNVLNQKKFRITFNHAFNDVMDFCASAERKNQDSTWITEEFLNTYKALHKIGVAQSVEAWNDKNELVGGLYGLTLKEVFFGESMFSLESNASKVCFIESAKRLKENGVNLIDCQAVNSHLKSLGAEEISQANFLKILDTTFRPNHRD